MIKMDKLDTNIIKSLNENGRKSLRTISKELKVSLSTIANRLRRMEDEGIIERYIPVINQEKAGLDLTAVINLKIGVNSDFSGNPASISALTFLCSSQKNLEIFISLKK